MPFTARHCSDGRCVEILYTGRVTADELQAAYEDAIALAVKLPRPLLLADCTGMTENPPLAGLYFLADRIAALPVERRVREAVLLPVHAGPGDSVTFWETACTNRGLEVKVFAERKAALDWLLPHA